MKQTIHKNTSLLCKNIYHHIRNIQTDIVNTSFEYFTYTLFSMRCVYVLPILLHVNS